MEDKYCVLIKPRKYNELKYNDMYCVRPLKEKERNDYVEREEQTIYNLPFEITNDIDEDIKIVSKQEYEEYKEKSIKKYEEFMKTYVSDLEFMNGE